MKRSKIMGRTNSNWNLHTLIVSLIFQKRQHKFIYIFHLSTPGLPWNLYQIYNFGKIYTNVSQETAYTFCFSSIFYLMHRHYNGKLFVFSVNVPTNSNILTVPIVNELKQYWTVLQKRILYDTPYIHYIIINL